MMITRGKNKRFVGIKNRTLLQVSVVVAAMILVFVVLFIAVFDSRTKTENITYTQNILQNTSDHLSDYFDEIGSIANEANYDYYLQQYLINAVESGETGDRLTRGKNMNYYRMSTKLFSSHLNSRTDVSSVMVFGNNSLLLHKSIYDYWSYIMDYSELDWYAQAAADGSKSFVTGPQHHAFLRGNTEPTLSLSRAISNCNDGSFLGVMLIDMNLNEIAKICQASYLNEQGSLILLDRGGKPVYQYHTAAQPPFPLEEGGALEKLQAAARSPQARSHVITIDRIDYQLVSEYCEKPDWYLLSVTPMAAITRGIYDTLAVILCSVILISVIIFLILDRVLTRIVRPVVNLTSSMEVAKAGDLDVRASIERLDEAGILAESFNSLLQRIKELMAKIVDEQTEKRKYELKALQAQINPHFLYNTLDSIVWMAELRDPNVVPMTEALAKLFRITLNKGEEFIRLRDELEHVRNYLFIQSMRYEDKFTYEISMQGDVADCIVIKLIVQPIVENCIYHGIKNRKGKGHIAITAFGEGGNLLIRVTDDGIGMSGRVCEEILTRESSGSSSAGGSGIGVKNVNERIQLHYGKQYGLRYTSMPDQGTTVEIVLPMTAEGELS